MTIVLAILIALIVVAFLVNFPIYASFISVPIALVRRVLPGMSSEVSELRAEEEEA